ncbi:helix-turn-helix transcriptional regulator [Gordonia sp. (in: high G+C Gram-positive bacteria)]|jgi:transcriptional regulator with XRE-family HTH domain|uniref:helix-turn-helix domain-containing protein n=1 Tax=Gordonia sp. (in: high G+C Gram-positive bacteria) TaxID=84139 RepID=UPI001D2CFF61|nr:helix-turn-helix transcriptional regulator [Gordonia sp. (in: high G+C Gram-positive bacteria)]MCB1296651.1 helix-turn-helix transcriptional regulator [Gordonia sp. (in: high G+C Gram-positive bacteria)]HMS75809.1 helix-turn-helix transcriptional regulator [Gordonia sp. (in: high G+C Gram-positive bacteria)]HQV17016.1 helix-turn-helix transcriptional regulator [Gordonia sp. (in: high G+C Gram-positive bacteria)]
MHQEGKSNADRSVDPDLAATAARSTSATDYFRSCMKARRESLEWSQRRLAKEIHERFGITLDPSAITRIENGQREPKYAESVAISELLGVPLRPVSETSDDVLKQLLDWYNHLSREVRRGVELRDRLHEVGGAANGLDHVIANLWAALGAMQSKTRNGRLVIDFDPLQVWSDSQQ